MLGITTPHHSFLCSNNLSCWRLFHPSCFLCFISPHHKAFCSRAIQSCTLLLEPVHCLSAWIQALLSAMRILLCPPQSQLPLCYLSPAAGISRGGFLLESWLLPSSTNTSPFTVLEGIQSPQPTETCRRSYHRIQAGVHKSTGVYMWGKMSKKVISHGMDSSFIFLHYGSKLLLLKLLKLRNKSYLTHIIVSLGEDSLFFLHSHLVCMTECSCRLHQTLLNKLLWPKAFCHYYYKCHSFCSWTYDKKLALSWMKYILIFL